MNKRLAVAALAAVFISVSPPAGPGARAETAPPPAAIFENQPQLHGLTKVAIGSFTVDVLDRLEADTKIGGIELVSGAPSNIVVTLKGVDAERYQALVDIMYDRFVADLQAQGVTVLPRGDLAALNPEYAKLESPPAHEEKSPAGTGRYLTSHGLPIYLVDETVVFPKMQFQMFGRKPERDPYISWGNAFGVGFAAQGFERQRELAHKLGAAIINVRITMLGGQAHIDNAFWKSAASVKTDAAMSFVPLYNRVLVVPEKGPMARVALGQPVTTAKLGDLVNVTSGGGKAAETGLNTAIAASRFMGGFVPGGSLIGSMQYQNHVAYEVRSDQATFEDAVSKGFGQVSATLTHEISGSPVTGS